MTPPILDNCSKTSAGLNGNQYYGENEEKFKNVYSYFERNQAVAGKDSKRDFEKKKKKIIGEGKSS